MKKEIEKVKCLIIGTGPAGYTAAIYAARADLKPVVYTGLVMGGQLTQTTDVDNFPGYPKGVQGVEMMEDLRAQAERFGTDIRFGVITAVDFSKRPFTVTTDDGDLIEAETVIISTGATAKWLGIDSEARYNGHGVSACATCDGFFYRGMDVAVVGGGEILQQKKPLIWQTYVRKYILLFVVMNYALQKQCNTVFLTHPILKYYGIMLQKKL